MVLYWHGTVQEFGRGSLVAEDYRDKIEEIRSRRRGNTYQPPTGGGPGGPPSPFDIAPQVGANRVAPSLGVNVAQQVQPTESFFGADFKSPWLRDRVTLSLEGQIAMMELRSNSRVNLVDLGYTNRIPILPIRSGIFVKIEPPGTYRLAYHYR